MKAVTSNAVNARIGYYNTPNNYPSSDIKQEIRNQFNSTTEYNYFFGKTNMSEEGAWWGFRQANTGTGLFITRGYVIEFYLDTDTFRSKVIMAGI